MQRGETDFTKEANPAAVRVDGWPTSRLAFAQLAFIPQCIFTKNVYFIDLLKDQIKMKLLC